MKISSKQSEIIQDLVIFGVGHFGGGAQYAKAARLSRGTIEAIVNGSCRLRPLTIAKVRLASASISPCGESSAERGGAA
jgi:hypothetical protein